MILVVLLACRDLPDEQVGAAMPDPLPPEQPLAAVRAPQRQERLLVRGTISSVLKCPPCPPDVHKCTPCQDHVVLSAGDDEVALGVSDLSPFSAGEEWLVIVRPRRGDALDASLVLGRRTR